MRQFFLRHQLHLFRTLVLFLLVATSTILSPSAFAKAFPEAQGFGENTRGGRGGRVIKVKNLNDSGPDSLRACAEASGPRICIFEIGGIIELETPIRITSPFITIAGQTAPGGGITLRNSLNNPRGFLIIRTHEVIIRYISSRPGPSREKSAQIDGITIGNPNADVYNVVVDHSSFSWGTDEVTNTWYEGTHDILFSWIIAAEGLNRSTHEKGPHSKGPIYGGGSSHITTHHSLFAHNNERNPLLSTGGGLYDITGNVIYNFNFGTHTNQASGLIKANITNNYYKPGPNTREYTRGVILDPKNQESTFSFWLQNNIGPHQVAGDEFSIAQRRDRNGPPYYFPVPDSFKASAPHQVPQVDADNPQQIYEQVLAEVGNSAQLLCDGTWRGRRDIVDQRLIAETRTGTGKFRDGVAGQRCITYSGDSLTTPSGCISDNDYTRHGITAELDQYGWPVLARGAACTDTDNDGMPDAYEDTIPQLSKTTPDDSGDIDQDGYTNIEEYLNGTSTPNNGDKECDGTPAQRANIDKDSANTVTILDYGVLIADFAKSTTGSQPYLDTDINCDDTVDILDFSLFIQYFGTSN